MSYQVKFHKIAYNEMRFLYDNNRQLFVSLIKIFDSLTACNIKEEIISIIRNQTDDYIEETITAKQVAFCMKKNVYVFFEIRGKVIKVAKIAVLKNNVRGKHD